MLHLHRNQSVDLHCVSIDWFPDECKLTRCELNSVKNPDCGNIAEPQRKFVSSETRGYVI